MDIVPEVWRVRVRVQVKPLGEDTLTYLLMGTKQRVVETLFGVWRNGLQLNGPGAQLLDNGASAIVVVRQGFDILDIVDRNKLKALVSPDLCVRFDPTAQEIPLVSIGNPGQAVAVESSRQPTRRRSDGDLMDLESPRVDQCLVPRHGVKPAVGTKDTGVGRGAVGHGAFIYTIEVEVYM